jgi:hypothetical protein
MSKVKSCSRLAEAKITAKKAVTKTPRTAPDSA